MMKFGKLSGNVGELSLGSNRKILWLCDCGKSTSASVYNVTHGRIKSCGRCRILFIGQDQKFGKLKIKHPQEILSGSHQKVAWTCDCGNDTVAIIKNVLSGNTTSCGKCTVVLATCLEQAKFGRLRIKEPADLHLWSRKKVAWICDCGRVTIASVNNVVKGSTKSCGKCSESVKDWYRTNRNAIRSLKFPVQPEDLVPGGPSMKEVAPNARDSFRAKCPCCNGEYSPRMYEIKQGGSLTCGCSAHRVSSPVLEIRDFLNQECVEVELEHKVDRLAYDIFVPSSNLLIELNGLRWHSMPGSKERDYRKWRHALDGRYGIIVLFEDEWKFSKNAVKAIISNRIRLAVRKMRPNMCFISAVSSEDADSFYSKNHYIGPCHPKISYGAFHQGRLIACCSFSHPTRQSKHTWELVRMASDPEYRIHGIWSKLLKMFCNLYSPISVVSFSDNRLFTGTVYERMGFKHDGEVLPDYYWVKGNRRFHKSAMRKRGEERISGKTETELREAQGYRKIWDLGKKRWVLTSGNI